MAIAYVATSKGLAAWGADVGLTKHLYKVGVSEEPADTIAAVLNAEPHAGHGDWRLLKTEPVEGLDEEAAIARLGQRERMVDPGLYPRIRGARGIFKVKLANVANHLLVKQALAGEEAKVAKVKAGEIAAYLIQNALR